MGDMTIQNAIHCMKAMICEEVCEECDYYGKTGTDHCEADAVRMAIKALEEQPERKKGKWIPVTNGRGGFECDRCHCYAPSYQDGVEWLSAFCPNCGCRMEGDEHE